MLDRCNQYPDENEGSSKSGIYLGSIKIIIMSHVMQHMLPVILCYRSLYKSYYIEIYYIIQVPHIMLDATRNFVWEISK